MAGKITMAREAFVEKLTSKWTGAAFFWVLNGFQGKYSDQLRPEHDKRNIWIGYVINLLFFLGIAYFFIIRK